jgi:hypothetical protein
MASDIEGVTDEGLSFEVVRSPEHPPVVLHVAAKPGTHWEEARVKLLVGQSLGFRWQGSVLLMRVTSARIVPWTRNRKVEVTLK